MHLHSYHRSQSFSLDSASSVFSSLCTALAVKDAQSTYMYNSRLHFYREFYLQSFLLTSIIYPKGPVPYACDFLQVDLVKLFEVLLISSTGVQFGWSLAHFTESAILCHNICFSTIEREQCCQQNTHASCTLFWCTSAHRPQLRE